MKLNAIRLLLFSTATALIVACGGDAAEPVSSLTPYPMHTTALTPLPKFTPTPVPTSTNLSMPEQKSTPPPWGLLASLPIEVSAVLATGPLLNDQRTFTGFGMPKTGSPEEVSPQWEFAALPGSSALAPVTGYVVAINTLWSDDWTIWISADGEDSWVWELEHVIDVQVAVGDFVEAGQQIATASVFGGRNTALVELGLLKGGRTPTHYCPLLYVDKDASSSIKAGLDEIRKENLERLKSYSNVIIPINDPNGQSCWTDLPVFGKP